MAFLSTLLASFIANALTVAFVYSLIRFERDMDDKMAASGMAAVSVFMLLVIVAVCLN